MSAGGINAKDAAKNLLRGVRGMGVTIPAIKAQLELKELIDAETERMKKEHDKIMKEAMKRLFYIALLIGALAIYETWIRPDLERAILKEVRNVKN